MKNPRQITLGNGTILRIEENMLWGFDSKNCPIDFTPAQRKILYKLAMNLNRPVSMTALYEAYTDQGVEIDDKGIRDNVTKVKNLISDSVKPFVKSVRGVGYKLIGTYGEAKDPQQHATVQTHPFSQEDHSQSPGHFADLSGDYYGFYLDPFGKQTILGAYLHIENAGTVRQPQLTAYAIVNVRNADTLLSDQIAQIFTDSSSDYRAAFKTFKQSLSDNGKRCSLLHGPVDADGTLVDITLKKDDTPEHWKILLDVAEYLRCKRDRENEKDFYRGGLGITLASRTIHGTFCFRLGVVRKTCIRNAMIQNHDEMINRLKILDDTRDAMWKPLKLSGYKDKIWYEWIMNE